MNVQVKNMIILYKLNIYNNDSFSRLKYFTLVYFMLLNRHWFQLMKNLHLYVIYGVHL